MTEIVNLRQVRKRQARHARQHSAKENRARFGRSRAEKEGEEARRAAEDAHIRAHQLRADDDDR